MSQLPSHVAGRLLVAAPTMNDPNFTRAVVLMLRHDAEGAFGLVLTQPVEYSMPEINALLEPWVQQLSLPRSFFAGGPVERNSIIGIARFIDDAERDWATTLGGGLHSVDLDSDPDNAAECVQFRLFVGYCGWGPMQLEQELASEYWFVVDTANNDPFDSSPESLWRRVLARDQRHRQWVQNFPDDPSAN